jgi:hypothetical protein
MNRSDHGSAGSTAKLLTSADTAERESGANGRGLAMGSVESAAAWLRSAITMRGRHFAGSALRRNKITRRRRRAWRSST